MKIGRNDPCNCGSGKKYKNCCLGRVDFNPSYSSSESISDKINLLGTMFNTGRYVELEGLAGSLLKAYPTQGVVWKLFGLSLQMQGKDALAAMQKAADLLPNDAEAHCNLAVVLGARGQLDAAVASGRKAIKIKPDFAEAHNNLAAALRNQGQLDAAVTSYRKAVELKPNFTEAHNNLGSTLQALGQLDGAVASYRRALQINPDFAEAHNNLGIALKDLAQLDDAVASFRRAMQIKPDYAETHNNLGLALKDLGQLATALASFRRALELKPDFAMAQDNLLLTLSYTTYPPEYCMEEARKYGQMVDKKVASRFSTWQCAAQPQRLRVGMVSGDLHNSPVGYFLECLIAHLDSERVELIAYPTSELTDALTKRIRPHFSMWKPLYGLNDEAAARQIHADGVHILLDLSGHTAKNRLPVFAWKPAPVQVSWLGYLATTGVSEMDYFLTDEVGVPEVQRQRFTESIWYLPDSMFCFTAPKVDLRISRLPALSTNMITFGCFQNLTRVNDDVLATWGRIFAALPNAMLRMQSKQLNEPAQREQLTERLQSYGITPSRVTMHGSTHREAYLASYAEVDLILDTFPYSGCTTTCEALWMGVPTLTLAGETLLSRQGTSVLTAAGMGEWITTSIADYIDRAIALTSDLPKLAALRSELRERVSTSPLFDAQRFARNFEDALWGMWRTKTQGNSVTSSSISDHAA